MANDENLRGRVDELRVWREVRTPAQICTSANRTWNGTSCQ